VITMPVFKDLYEMIRQLMDEEEEEIESTINEAEKEIEGMIPLYTRYEEGGSLYYIIDVPFINYSTVYVKIEKNYLDFTCQDKKQRKYTLKIKIPEKYQNYDVKVINYKGFVKIVLSKA